MTEEVSTGSTPMMRSAVTSGQLMPAEQPALDAALGLPVNWMSRCPLEPPPELWTVQVHSQ